MLSWHILHFVSMSHPRLKPPAQSILKVHFISYYSYWNQTSNYLTGHYSVHLLTPKWVKRHLLPSCKKAHITYHTWMSHPCLVPMKKTIQDFCLVASTEVMELCLKSTFFGHRVFDCKNKDIYLNFKSVLMDFWSEEHSSLKQSKPKKTTTHFRTLLNVITLQINIVWYVT